MTTLQFYQFDETSPPPVPFHRGETLHDSRHRIIKASGRRTDMLFCFNDACKASQVPSPPSSTRTATPRNGVNEATIRGRRARSRRPDLCIDVGSPWQRPFTDRVLQSTPFIRPLVTRTLDIRCKRTPLNRSDRLGQFERRAPPPRRVGGRKRSFSDHLGRHLGRHRDRRLRRVHLHHDRGRAKRPCQCRACPPSAWGRRPRATCRD